MEYLFYYRALLLDTNKKKVDVWKTNKYKLMSWYQASNYQAWNESPFIRKST